MGTKQVIVIRRDLKMRRGKECVQAAHAGMWWLARPGRLLLQDAEHEGVYSTYLSPAERHWLRNDFRKITVQVGGLDELLDIYGRALYANLEANVVVDCGLTEFKEPTTTCLVIGPDWDEKIDPITKDLKLY